MFVDYGSLHIARVKNVPNKEIILSSIALILGRKTLQVDVCWPDGVVVVAVNPRLL